MGTRSEDPVTPCVQIFLPNGGPSQRDAPGSRARDKGSFPQSTGSCPWSPGPRRYPYLIVHRDAVGPADADVNQHHALGTVQPGPLNTWVLAPLGPEQVPVGRRAPGLSPQHTEERALSEWAVGWPACPAPHPFSGWTVMARGLSRPWEMTT